MVKPVVDFMQNYTQTPNRIYDLYQYYLGGGSNQAGTGAPPGYQQPIPRSSGGGQGGIGALQANSPMTNFSNFYGYTSDKFFNKQSPNVSNSFFGFPTQRQDVNPVDAGAYLAAGMSIPQTQTMAGKLQSGVNKTKAGLASILGKVKSIGPITGILSAMDRFNTLSPTDQSFIESTMGYTGPTVFGANDSGLSKDPFGINTRSAFGNYADFVGKEADKLGKSLEKSANKAGLSFDPTTGEVTGGTEEEIAEWEKQTQMLNTKFNFYTQMTKQKTFNEKLYKQKQEAMKKDVARVQARVNRNEDRINQGAEKGTKTGTVNPHSEYGKSKGYTGGTHNPHTDTGWSGSSKNGGGGKGGGKGGGESGYGGFCFDPNTFVQMANGSEKKIKNIQLGDNTKGGEVTGVFQFKASDEIHDYKGVTVAGSHYVKEDGKFIMVQDSPLSVKIDKIPVVYSLDTTGRRIFINDIEFADYNGDGVAKGFLANAGINVPEFNKEVLRQVEQRLI